MIKQLHLWFRCGWDFLYSSHQLFVSVGQMVEYINKSGLEQIWFSQLVSLPLITDIKYRTNKHMYIHLGQLWSLQHHGAHLWCVVKYSCAIYQLIPLVLCQLRVCQWASFNNKSALFSFHLRESQCWASLLNQLNVKSSDQTKTPLVKCSSLPPGEAQQHIWAATGQSAEISTTWEAKPEHV